MLKGIDISSYQGDPNYDTLKKNVDFVISKASEGNGFVDPKVRRNQSEARRVGLATGYYHFARPDLGNTPEDEAQAFINSFWPALAGEMFVLDYEVNYPSPVAWCKKFLDYLAAKTNGTKALIYLNKYLITSYNWKPIVDAGYGLWVAYYDNNPSDIPFTTLWPVVAMKQYTSSAIVPGVNGRVDANSFFGDLNAYKKYGYKASVDPYKEKCQILQVSIDRVKHEFNNDMLNPSANYQAIYKSTTDKLRKIADTGSL